MRREEKEAQTALDNIPALTYEAEEAEAKEPK